MQIAMRATLLGSLKTHSGTSAVAAAVESGGERLTPHTAADQSWREMWLTSTSWKETSVARPYLYWNTAPTRNRSLWKWEQPSTTDKSSSMIQRNAARCLQCSQGSLTQRPGNYTLSFKCILDQQFHSDEDCYFFSPHHNQINLNMLSPFLGLAGLWAVVWSWDVIKTPWEMGNTLEGKSNRACQKPQ